jgi:hypothetical protein
MISSYLYAMFGLTDISGAEMQTNQKIICGDILAYIVLLTVLVNIIKTLMASFTNIKFLVKKRQF